MTFVSVSRRTAHHTQVRPPAEARQGRVRRRLQGSRQEDDRKQSQERQGAEESLRRTSEEMRQVLGVGFDARKGAKGKAQD